jgi:hypothetical protein
MGERMDSFEARLESMAGNQPTGTNVAVDGPTTMPETPTPVSGSAVAETDEAAETAADAVAEAAAETPINAIPETSKQPDEPGTTASAAESPVKKAPPVVTPEQVASGQAASEPKEEAEEPDASIGAGSVDVVLNPLLDISLARAVESALNGSDEILRAGLREVRSDTAVIDTAVKPGVSVVAVLRSRLPVSFRVVESDSRSVTIALAQPANGDADDSAVPEAS